MSPRQEPSPIQIACQARTCRQETFDRDRVDRLGFHPYPLEPVLVESTGGLPFPGALQCRDWEACMQDGALLSHRKPGSRQVCARPADGNGTLLSVRQHGVIALPTGLVFGNAMGALFDGFRLSL